VNADDWCELTSNFQPKEHLEHVIELLGKYRVFSTDDDRLYLFTNAQLAIQHSVYRAGTRWICPCQGPRPCPAVAVMQLASFSWTMGDEDCQKCAEALSD
jgi:hypothetical protein